MKLNLMKQSIEYTFMNETYPKGVKSRRFQNVKPEATSEQLYAFGNACTQLQKGDALGSVVLIQHQAVEPETEPGV